MIVKREYHKYDRYRRRRNYVGYFLLGFIPLYIRRSDFVN